MGLQEGGQQWCRGRRLPAGERGEELAGACDVLVTDGLLQFWVGNELLKTAARTSSGPVRKLHADGTAPRGR